jgi:hypothetical protein
VVIVFGRNGEAGRQCDIVRELAGDFVVYKRFFAEPADRANDEERGQVAISIERHGRAPRHGSSWSFGGKRTVVWQRDILTADYADDADVFYPCVLCHPWL